MNIFENQRLVTLNARQHGLVEKWGLEFKGIGTVVAVTGFGKTVVGIKAIKRILEHKPERKVLVVVPSEPLFDQWKERLSKENLNNAQVMIINTAITMRHDVDLLVLDEIHRFQSTEFSRIFQVTYYKFILGLTATIDFDKARIINTYCPVVDTVSLEEALKNNWISDFTIYNIPIFISEESNTEYQKWTKVFNTNFAVFNHDFEIAMSCVTSNEARFKFAKELATYEMYNTDEYKSMSYSEKVSKIMKIVHIKALQWNKAMRERKNLLYESDEKIEAAAYIINKYTKYKVIAFSQSKAFADKLAEKTNSKSYHSGVTKAKRKKILDWFSSVDKGALCTAKALDEGADIPDVTLTINCAYTGSKIQGRQRLGRGVRYVEGKKAIEINFYVAPDNGKHSQEYKWLKQKQKGMPNIKWLSSLEEIDLWL